jgi:predicted nucleotidyltransferase
MNNHLKEIIISLAAAEIKFVICGGVAVVLHGVERLTMDIDLAVSMETDNLSAMINVMHDIDMTPRVPVPAETLLDPDMRKIMVSEKNALVFTFIDIKNPYRQVDIFLQNENLYQEIIRDSSVVEICGYKISVISIEKLIQMKKEVNPPREKDLSDIRELMKIMDYNNEQEA